MAFVGTSDIFEEPINQELLKDFRQAVKEAYEMIRVESGVAELDGLFRSITKSSPGGRLIDGYKAIKAAHEKKGITSRLSTFRPCGPPPDRFSVALQTGRLAQR
ncbi:hypothetical protein DK37_19485 [Halomonas sp. SUBG004]|nr:hypothetical protein DK37_19485 [Halomonas sp. SUBG004]